MSIDLSLPELPVLHSRITIVGSRQCCGNAVNNLIQSNSQGVNFVVANTDAQSIEKSLCDKNIQLGINLTNGLVLVLCLMLVKVQHKNRLMKLWSI